MYLCSSANNQSNCHFLHPKINHMTQMQGIVSILRSDNPENTTKAVSLRRTLSADMSSKKWLADNGLPLMKKIASSEQIAVHSSSSSEYSDEEECEVDEKIHQNPTSVDIWTAIMSQKKQDESVKPYVHPLVKKSASSLSEKSLKICTESLGSETGSDVFSLSASSDQKCDEEREEEKEKKQHKVGRHVFTCLPTKKAQHSQAQARSFPPPIPSLVAAKTDGPSLHMHSRRVNGRLVLEAVSVQQQKYFEAQRQDGRFLLTLVNEPNEQPSDNDNDLHEKQEHETKPDFNNKDIGILKKRQPNSTKPLINLHKSTVTVKRNLETDNENPSWSKKLNTKETPRSRATGLPPLPPPTAATVVNSYEYFWRAKPTVASVISQNQPPAKTKDMVLLRGNKADCFLPSLKGCKEPRRSVLMWEPFCIATS